MTRDERIERIARAIVDRWDMDELMQYAIDGVEKYLGDLSDPELDEEEEVVA